MRYAARSAYFTETRQGEPGFCCSSDHVGSGKATALMKEDDALRPTANSTTSAKAVDSRALVSSSRKGSELTIEALYVARLSGADVRDRSVCAPRTRPDHDEVPDEGERARMISDLTRLIREPHMPETTRCAGLTLIGWLARRMPGEAAHAIGVSEARQSERRLRAAQRKAR
jgi:hypothetical protein